jgi:hypothetical protein
MFDDPRHGLVREPFVSGADTMIDQMVADLPFAAGGFSMWFSAGWFRGSQLRLDWIRQEDGGNWYRSEALGLDGWLCPALFNYFRHAPKHIFVLVMP